MHNMRFKAVIFDVDDTLYPEREFVGGGFRAVADYLTTVYSGKSVEEIQQFMLANMDANGRGHVFDDTLRWLQLDVPQYLSTLLFIYRTHIPGAIKMDADMRDLIVRLRENDVKLGIITDGIYVTQKNKTDVLLRDIPFDCVIHTDTLGTRGWKPSTEPFRVATNLLRVNPEDGVYIGDNPVKDFAGARNLGMKTIWWNPGKLQHSFSEEVYMPDFEAFDHASLYHFLSEAGVAE
ncbi:MAG: HAD family hydrolase [Bacteroidetes bacterium]|nr:HAD family hydrolase [Bacteroidota bacterium]